MSFQYPNFCSWRDSKVIPGLIVGERSLIVVINNDAAISGLAIVKNSEAEKKLCCLRVSSSYQGSGMGVRLFKLAFEELGEDKPLLSISNDKLEEFNKIFNYFNFEFGNDYWEMYKKNKFELSFNGLLNSF